MWINCRQQMEKSTYQSTLTGAQMEVVKAPSQPAPILRSAAVTLLTQSVRSHGRTRGWRGASCWETNRDTQQHNVKVNRNTSHQCIRPVYAGSSSGVYRAALPMYEEWSVPHKGGGKRESWMTDTTGGFSIGECKVFFYLFFVSTLPLCWCTRS